MIKNSTLNTSSKSKNLHPQTKGAQNEYNPADSTVDFLLAYSKALNVKSSEMLGDIFELQN